MKDFRRIGNSIFTCLLLLIVAIAVYVLFAGARTSSTQLIQHRAVSLDRGWYFYDILGQRHPVRRLPATVPSVDAKSRLFIDIKKLPPLLPGDEFDRYLCFFSRHQDITVSLDNRIIYHSEIVTKPSWIQSYRSQYHLVALPPDFLFYDTICIESEARVHSAAGQFDTVLIGGRSHLMQTVLISRYVRGLFGLSLLVAALFLFSTAYIFHSFIKDDLSLLFLSALALCLGLWQLEDSRVLQFVSGYQPLHWCFEYLTQVAMPIFVYLYLRHIDREEKSLPRWWLGSLTALFPLLQLVLQVSGICPLPASVYLSYILYICDCVYMIVFLQRHGASLLNRALSLLFIFSLVIFTFIFVAMLFRHIFFDGVISLGIFITFNAMVLFSFRHVLRKAQDASRNEVYKTLAFTDIATGVQNKTAWYTLIDNFVPAEPAEEYALTLFDMNNLKKTNDTYGHLVGDEMIKAFAHSVQQSFEGTGTVYRIGGDEFVALCHSKSRRAVDSALSAFALAVKNQPASDHPFSAAYGTTWFTPQSRKDFEEAVTGSDSQMYEQKVAMKANRSD